MNRVSAKVMTVMITLALLLGLASFGHAAGSELAAEPAGDPVLTVVCPQGEPDGLHGHGTEICSDCLSCSPMPAATADTAHASARAAAWLQLANPPPAPLVREHRPPRILLI